jgi:hypothetical protein
MYFIEFCVWDCLLLYVHTTVVLHRPTGQDWVHYAPPPLVVCLGGGGGPASKGRKPALVAVHMKQSIASKSSHGSKNTQQNLTPRHAGRTARTESEHKARQKHIPVRSVHVP